MQGLTFGRNLITATQRLGLKELIDPLEKHMAQAAGNQNLSANEKQQFASAVLKSRAAWENTDWDQPSKDLLSALGAGTRLSDEAVTRLIVTFQRAGASANLKTDELVQSTYHWARSLLVVAQAAFHLLVESRTDKTEGEELLEVVITDYGEGLVDLDRLQMVLASLQRLHDAMASLLGEEGSRLRLRAVDSGSEILLIVVASAAVIGAVRGLFNDVVDRVRFRPNELAERNFESLRAGLGALAEIRKRSRRDDLSNEAAEKLEHVVLEHIAKLISAGSLPTSASPEVVSNAQFLLAQRDQRLLGAGGNAKAVSDDEQG